MNPPPATLAETVTHLASVPAETKVRFHTPSGDVGRGYHLTELKLADINSIDCGGHQSRYSQAQMQILDGRFGGGLTAKKMAGIIAKSIDAIEGLGTAPLVIEFGHGNRQMSQFVLDHADFRDGVLSVALAPTRAKCKPMSRSGQTCCG